MRRIFSWTSLSWFSAIGKGGVCLFPVLATEEEILLLLIGRIEGRIEYATITAMMVDVSGTYLHSLLTRNFLHILGRTAVN